MVCSFSRFGISIILLISILAIKAIQNNEDKIQEQSKVRNKRLIDAIFNRERHKLDQSYKLQKRYLEAKKAYERKCLPKPTFNHQSCPPLDECIDSKEANNFLDQKIWMFGSLHDKKRKVRHSAYEAYESKCRGNIVTMKKRACPSIDRVKCESIALNV